MCYRSPLAKQHKELCKGSWKKISRQIWTTVIKFVFNSYALTEDREKSLCRPDNVAKSQTAKFLKRAIPLITTTRRWQDLPNATKCWFLKEIPEDSNKVIYSGLLESLGIYISRCTYMKEAPRDWKPLWQWFIHNSISCTEVNSSLLLAQQLMGHQSQEYSRLRAYGHTVPSYLSFHFKSASTRCICNTTVLMGLTKFSMFPILKSIPFGTYTR